MGGDGDAREIAETCDDLARDARIDGLAVDARPEVGLQGAAMLVVGVDFLGAGAPSWAEYELIYADPRSGEETRRGTVAQPTAPSAEGRRTTEDYWTLWTYGERVRVTVSAYGREEVVEVCEYGDCVGDAGP